MGRRSYIAPLFLIAFGLLLLVWNLSPDFRLSELFIRHWPWILIVWGGFRLAEYALDRAAGRSPAAPMGVGTVLLATMICGAGMTARAVPGWKFQVHDWFGDAGNLFSARHEFRLSLEHPGEGAGSLIVRQMNGRLHFVKGDSLSILVSGEKQVRALTREAASRLDDTARISLTRRDNAIVLEGFRADPRLSRLASADLRIQVPPGLALTIEDCGGDIRVDGLDEAIDIRSGGNFRIEHAGSEISIDSRTGGSLTVRDARAGVSIRGSARRLDLERVAGSAEIESRMVSNLRLAGIQGAVTIRAGGERLSLAGLPGELSWRVGRVELEGADGPIEMTFGKSRRVAVKRWRGILALTGDRADVALAPSGAETGDARVAVEQGRIVVEIPPGLAYRLDAQTGRGAIEGKLPLGATPTAQGNGAALSAGEGAVHFELKTGRGDIKIESVELEVDDSVRL